MHPVRIEAFWMSAHEVTWDEYRLFMFANQAGETANKDPRVDAVSRPTRPYVEMSFGMGIDGYPAISMTQHAANKYAEWLSAKTGKFYRLADGSRMGVRVPRRLADRVPVGRRCFEARRIRVVRGQLGRQVPEGRDEEAQRVGLVRHAGQRHGVDARSIRALRGFGQAVN